MAFKALEELVRSVLANEAEAREVVVSGSAAGSGVRSTLNVEELVIGTIGDKAPDGGLVF